MKLIIDHSVAVLLHRECNHMNLLQAMLQIELVEFAFAKSASINKDVLGLNVLREKSKNFSRWCD
jgi:hypothetical protein